MDHALEFDDDLAHALTVLQRRQSLCRVRERKAHGNVRTDRAAGMEGDYFIEIGLALFRFAAGEVAIEDADDLAALEQGKVERQARSEEHTSELQSLMRISYAVLCLKKKKTRTQYQLD